MQDEEGRRGRKELDLNVVEESREGTQIKRTLKEWREEVGGGGAREEQRVDNLYEYTQRAID